MIRQVTYHSYDLMPVDAYRRAVDDPDREDGGICRKHHRIVSCQIPYSASRAVQQS